MIVLWRQRDDDPEQWTYLERMLPGEFSYEIVKQRWGGGAYRIRLFGAWDRTRRQEKYITHVAFWIRQGFPPHARTSGAAGPGEKRALTRT